MNLNVIEKDIHQTTEDSQNSTSDFVNVDISEFYGEDFVGAEYVEVTEDVLDYIIAQKRIEKRKEIIKIVWV